MTYHMSKRMRPDVEENTLQSGGKPHGEAEGEHEGFFRRLTAARKENPEDVDLKNEVGQTAGVVYNFLEKNGESHLRDLRKTMEGKGPLLMASLGWLLREDKITVKVTQQGIRVKLK